MQFLNTHFKYFILSLILLSVTQSKIKSENTVRDSFMTEKNIEKIDQNIKRIQKNIRKQPDSLENLIRKNMALSIAENYQYGMAWNYFFMGRYYQLKLKNDSAITYYKKAWPLAKQNSIFQVAESVSIGLANIYWESGNYSSGLEFALEAKSYFEDHHLIQDKYGLFNLIALDYEGLFEYETALRYFRQALSMADSMKKEVFVGIIYSNIGRLYFKQNDYAQALDFLIRGVKIEEEFNHIANAGKSYTTIANAYLKLNKSDSSFKYLQKAYQYNKESKDKVGLTRTYLAFGEYYYQKKQYSTSTEYLNQAIELAEDIKLNNELINSYKQLALNYQQTGNYKKSAEMYIKYIELYQKIYNVERINQVNALEHKLKLQTKETEVSLLKLKQENQSKRIFFITTLSSILISLFLILFLLYYRRNNKLLRRKNAEITNQKETLEYLNQKLILAEQNADKVDEMKNKFLNNLTHEIRTPLNGIVGFSSLIAESKLTDERKTETWNIIRKNSEDLINTIEGLLKLSMIASNQIKVKKNDIQVGEFLQNIYNECTYGVKSLYSQNVNFNYVDNDALEHLVIHTDKSLLKQAVKQILNNAFKFTQKGYINLGYTSQNNHIQIYISDTGIGIMEDSKDSIFKQFTKGSNIPNNSGGLGIGLTLSKQFVELLNGNLHYETELNKGSTFYITLPV